jgi:hypothetical protein
MSCSEVLVQNGSILQESRNRSFRPRTALTMAEYAPVLKLCVSFAEKRPKPSRDVPLDQVEEELGLLLHWCDVQ